MRWSFAALVHHSIQNIPTTSSSTTEWTVPEARRLCDAFASSSYGDTLFGGAVALLFYAPLASIEVQLEALIALEDGRAFHLLPSIDACLGGYRLNYLNPPPPPSHSSSSVTASSTSASTTTMSTTTSEDKTAENVYLRLLSVGETLKCVDSGSLILSVVLHRLALLIFCCSSSGDDDETMKKKKKKQQNALLQSAIRRLGGGTTISGENGGNRGLMALGMFLRWSCEEGAAVDVFSADRMDFLKAAVCGGRDDDGADDEEGLFKIAMAALRTV